MWHERTLEQTRLLRAQLLVVHEAVRTELLGRLESAHSPLNEHKHVRVRFLEVDKHLVRLEPIVEVEKPLEIFARLNIKHGPNTDNDASCQ